MATATINYIALSPQNPIPISVASARGTPVGKGQLDADLDFNGAPIVPQTGDTARYLWQDGASLGMNPLCCLNSVPRPTIEVGLTAIDGPPPSFVSAQITLKDPWNSSPRIVKLTDSSGGVTGSSGTYMLDFMFPQSGPFALVGEATWTLFFLDMDLKVLGNVEVPSFPMELYILPFDLPPNLFSKGIPLTLLRIFVQPTATVPINETQDWIALVTKIAHGSAKPFTGANQATESHWLAYDTFSGRYSFAGGTHGYSFKLEAWCDAWRNYKNYNVRTSVNCYDQAGIVQAALVLGMDYHNIAWEYSQVFGFIRSDVDPTNVGFLRSDVDPSTPPPPVTASTVDTKLVGWGSCNNPYFEDDLTQIILPRLSSDRSPFRNHAYLSWNPAFNHGLDQQWLDANNDPVEWEAISGNPAMLIIDACAGPHCGTETRSEYAKSKDQPGNYPPGHMGENADPSDTFEKNRWKAISLWTSGVHEHATAANDKYLQMMQLRDQADEMITGISALTSTSQLAPPASSNAAQNIFNGDILQLVQSFNKTVRDNYVDPEAAEYPAPVSLTWTNVPINDIPYPDGSYQVESKEYKLGRLDDTYYSIQLHVCKSSTEALTALQHRMNQISILSPKPLPIQLQEAQTAVTMVGGKFFKAWVFANVVVECSSKLPDNPSRGRYTLQKVADQVVQDMISTGVAGSDVEWSNCLKTWWSTDGSTPSV